MIKIIEGKHYVDGGPKCDRYEEIVSPVTQQTVAEHYCEAGLWYETNYDYDKDIKRGEPIRIGLCPSCHGTGTPPVESWTDNQRAAWIKKTTNCDGLNLFWFIDPEADGKIIWGIRICYEDAPPVEYKLGHHEDISDALCAAVIAVAEESK